MQGMLWRVGGLEGMLRASAELGELDEVVLRCADVQLACAGGSGVAGGEEGRDCSGLPMGGAARAARSVSIRSPTGAVKVKHIIAGLLELVRGVPGCDRWVFDGMSKCSPAGWHPVVYDVSFIQ